MSKRAKALRQMQKNAQDDLTDEINEKFMTLQKSGILVQGKVPIVQHSNNSCDINYDSLVNLDNFHALNHYFGTSSIATYKLTSLRCLLKCPT